MDSLKNPNPNPNQHLLTNSEQDLIQAMTRLINTMSLMIDSYSRLHEDYHNVTATLQRIETKVENLEK